MPLGFGNKFSPRKTPPRKQLSMNNLNKLDRSEYEVEYGNNYDQPKLSLGGQILTFVDGEWCSETGGGVTFNNKAAAKMKKQVKELSEENNLLKLKVELLLDMLSVTKAENQKLQELTGTFSSD